MRHRRRTRRLGRTTPHRQAMMRNMVASLFRYGRIKTTDTRAKELRRLADKMVTLAKDGSLHARRQALSVIRDRDVVAKLFEELKQKFVSRNGGYTRIIKIGPRRGDAALMSYVELVIEGLERPKRRKKGRGVEAAAGAASVIPQAKEAAEETEEKAAEEPAGESESPEEADSGEMSVEPETGEGAGPLEGDQATEESGSAGPEEGKAGQEVSAVEDEPTAQTSEASNDGDNVQETEEKSSEEEKPEES